MKRFLISIIILFSLILAACGPSLPAQTPSSGSTQPPATSVPSTETPSATATLAPAATAGSPTTAASLVDPTLVNQLSNTCSLLNSRDLASIMTTGETQKEPIKVNAVDHPIFSTQNVPTSEVTCAFYTFQQPGSHNNQLMQVTYWVDMPREGASAAAWQQAWSQAEAAGKPLQGIGESAFMNSDGRLSFRQGNVYFTIEVIQTHLSADQIDQVAQQIAKDMLTHLQALSTSG